MMYIGAPYQLTRADKDGRRGGYIFDVDTKELEFVENKVSARFVSFEYPKLPNPSEVKGNIVDIFVRSGDFGNGDIEDYTNAISAMEPLYAPTVQMVEDSGTEELKVDVENKTMSQVLEEYLDLLEDVTEEERNEIKTEFRELMEKVSE